MPLLIPCSCCIHPVPVFIPSLCLFYAHVYPMLVYIPCPCSFHARIYPIPMFISSPCHVFTTSSCLTVCRLYPALVLKDQINFNITTEYLKPFFPIYFH